MLSQVSINMSSERTSYVSGKVSKTAKSQSSGKFFGQIPEGRAALGPLIVINFTLFNHFQDHSHQFAH